MARIIVDYPDDMKAHEACYYVLQATKDGKVSVAAGVPHFCWGTRFQNGVMVATRRKKPNQKSDSFLVYREASNAQTDSKVEESPRGETEVSMGGSEQ